MSTRMSEISRLIEKLVIDADPLDRCEAAWKLGKLGAIAPEAIPPLALALTCDGDLRVKHDAGAALGKIGRAAVPALIKALTHPLSTVQEIAARALREIGPPAEAAIQPLKKAIQEGCPNTRDFAKLALRSIEANDVAT